jgi:16S rRNA (guanine527-N7)-methyltransferase
MAAISNDAILTHLEPFFLPFEAVLKPSNLLIEQVSAYLDLLIRWNSRVSLTAIRRPEEMVERHFGESFFTGAVLAQRIGERAELLDYGSGPGFPGLPIQILLPHVRVTLAESQAKKVAFLREVIRTLGLKAEVWPRRVEEIPESRQFDVVTMRAVEHMAASVEAAKSRVREGGLVAALVGKDVDSTGAEEFAFPGSEHRRLQLWCNVPRGTSAE